MAYGQFCRHFLSPLALMSKKDVRLGLLLRNHIDGVPLDLASYLLPFARRLRFPTLMHIHLHARSKRKYAEAELDPESLQGVSRRSLIARS